MSRGDLIATIMALPFCIAMLAWFLSGTVEHFTQ